MTRRKFGQPKKLPSGRWGVVFTGPDGGRHTAGQSFKTKRLAEQWLNREEAEIDRLRAVQELGRWIPPRDREKAATTEEAGALLVGKWLEQWLELLESKVKPQTMRKAMQVANARILAPKFPADATGKHVDAVQKLAVTPLGELAPAIVHAWWDGVVAIWPEQDDTNKRAYRRLKQACVGAVDREIIPANPVEIKAAQKAVKHKEEELPTDDEIRAIVKAAPARLIAVAALCYMQGLRIGEALAVTTDNIVDDGETMVIRIRRNAVRLEGGKRNTKSFIQNATKTDAGRRDVRVLAPVAAIVREHLKAFPPVAVRVPVSADGRKTERMALLTTNTKGAPYFDTNARDQMRKACEHKGVKWHHPHLGRKWLITHMAEKGATIREIGAVMGQVDEKTITKIYMKVNAGRTESILDQIGADLGEV